MTPDEAAVADDIAEKISRELDEDYVQPWTITWHLRRQLVNPSQAQLLELGEAILRRVVGTAVQVGDLDGWSGEFHPWPADTAVDRVMARWRALGRDPQIGEIGWLYRPPAEDADPSDSATSTAVPDGGSLLEVDRDPLLLFDKAVWQISHAVAWWQRAGLTVRVTRGRKMRTEDGLFDEFAAALQFPYYFGDDWDAFDKFLCDLGWLPMDTGIVIVVLQAGEVLADADDHALGRLAGLIAKAGQGYSQLLAGGGNRYRPPVPFHIVLHADPADAAAVRARWEAAGAVVTAYDE